MRSRNIKTGFWINEDLGDLPHWVRLMFIGLWCLAGKNGVLEDRPKRIKGELFRYDDLTADDVDKALSSLQDFDFIQRYQVDGKPLIHIKNFVIHQRPHHTEKESLLPLPDATKGSITVSQPLDNGYVTDGSPLDNHEFLPDSLIPDSLIPDSLKNTSSFCAQNDGGGLAVRRENGGNGDATNDANDANRANGATGIPDARLKKPSLGRKAPIEQWLKALGNGLRTWFEEEWWPLQLRKVGKKECVQAIYDLNPDVALRARMSSALSKQVRDDYQHRDLDKVPHPATWVNGSRWEDEGQGQGRSRFYDD